MDVQKKQYLRKRNVKYFTINAIAAVVLTFNSEIASAASCPTIITINTPAVCNFDAGSSVTLTSAGTVGGIIMAGYHPSGSFITVDAGGAINDNLNAAAIILSNSSLSDGILNNGTISNTTGAGIAIGTSSVVSGGILNNGLISTGLAGIGVELSTVNGGISNGGTISSASITSIRIANSRINGDIANSGTINAHTTGVNIVSMSVISGNILNSGVINSSGIGINISNFITINGDISNNGTINADDGGINIFTGSTIAGNISNSGTIQSAGGTGIRIISASRINGGISNSGTIQTHGNFVGITISNSSVISNGIVNTGLIEAKGSGDAILLRNGSTVNGGISNSGIIRSTDHTGISVINSSAIQGNISNDGTISGELQGLSIHNGSFLGGDILNNGIISGNQQQGLSIFSSTTISGGISNAGLIRGGTTGIAVTSSSTMTGAISNSGTIQGDINAILINSNSVVDGINILGQSARMIGAVDAAGTDVNITSGAIFTSEGTFNVRTFNIDSNALFNMTGTITANSVNNSGTLAATTLQTIMGDYIQNTGGIFQTSVSSASNYGSIAATGTVDLSQSGNISVQVNSNASLHAGDVLSNVISGNTLITPDNGFTVTDNSFFWTFNAMLTDNNTGVNLTTSVNPQVYSACQGDFCQGAATAIINQVAAGNALFNPYATLPTANAFANAASQATPELTNENIQVTQLVTRSVMDIVPMWSMLHGKSAGDAMVYEEGKIWLKPYGGSMTQNESNSVDGFNATAYGVVVGKDTQLTEDSLLGGALAVGGDNIDGKSTLNGQSINSDTFQGMLYGAKRFPHNIYLAGQGLLGYGSNSTERNIPLYSSTADGTYNSWFTNLRSQLGWNYAMNPRIILTPELDASYLFVNQGGYQETGSPMDLSVDSSNNSSFVLGAYGNGAFHLTTLSNKEDITLTAYAGVARNLLNSTPETTATFVAGGPSFTTFGVQFDETVFRGGAGLTMTNPVKPFRVNVNYDMQKGNSAYSGVGSVTIAYLM